jgi:hypothetical protein
MPGDLQEGAAAVAEGRWRVPTVGDGDLGDGGGIARRREQRKMCFFMMVPGWLTTGEAFVATPSLS